MTDQRTIADLLDDLPRATLVAGDATPLISSVEHDSRRVSAGTLFVAVPGFTVDGHRYLQQAAAQGAAAVLVQQDHEASWSGLAGTAVIAVDDTRSAMARAASWFYGHPGRELTVIGITGTDGKTTTSHLLTHVLESAGIPTGRLGTVDVYMPGATGKVTDRMTTPESPEVQRLLREMVTAGCRAAIVESTSHGLALHRLDDVEYDVAVVTNITGDHLDFHKTFDAYRDAKAQLFAALETSVRKDVPKTAVVNADDPSASYLLSQALRANHIRYGLESRETDVTATDIALRPDGTSFTLVAGGTAVRVGLALPAIFNVMNALAAASAAVALGLDTGAIAAGLSGAPGVPGRMERIDAGQPFEVIVDYAHTGEAVRKVLQVLRAISHGRLIIVVGAAGERDPGRRFGVGRAAADGADFAIFTSEDPRSEDPAAIVAEIGQHAVSAGREPGRDFLEIEDRREAIATAFRRARAGDVVVVAGKGHEKSIVYGTESRPWDDRDVAREELAKLGFGH